MKSILENTIVADNSSKKDIKTMSWNEIKANLGAKMTLNDVLKQIRQPRT
jgi:hypothetical protein